MKTVGIIGFGSFGKFLAEQLAPFCTIRVYSASGKENQWATSLKEVASSDYIILAIPLQAYPAMLARLKPLLNPKAVIIDVCSVKKEPMQTILKLLPGHKYVATHPLFGPESAKDGLEGHVLVLCPDFSDSAELEFLKRFAKQLKLRLVSMTVSEHDEEMATVHGLTFFIAHTLKEMGLHDQKLATPSFKKLLALAELEKHHSSDLFFTIQSGNRYVEAVRREFLEKAKKIDNQTKKASNHN